MKQPSKKEVIRAACCVLRCGRRGFPRPRCAPTIHARFPATRSSSIAAGTNGNGTSTSPFNSLGRPNRPCAPAGVAPRLSREPARVVSTLPRPILRKPGKRCREAPASPGAPLTISGAQHISIYGFTFSGISSAVARRNDQSRTTPTSRCAGTPSVAARTPASAEPRTVR